MKQLRYDSKSVTEPPELRGQGRRSLIDGAQSELLEHGRACGRIRHRARAFRRRRIKHRLRERGARDRVAAGYPVSAA
jgi:hypothetical protein